MALTHDRLRRAAVEQMEKVTADRVVVGLDIDALAVVAPVIPVEQHRALRRQQAVGGCRARRARRGRPSRAAPLPSADTPVRSTSIGWAAAGTRSRISLTGSGSPRSDFKCALYADELRARSAACRGRAGTRSPRIRRLRRCRGCRSRDRRGRCPCARPCKARVLPAATPESATDFLGLGAVGAFGHPGLLGAVQRAVASLPGGERARPASLVRVIAEIIVELGARLHRVDDGLLRAVARAASGKPSSAALFIARNADSG